MNRWYLDSSAALKLIVREAESAALAAAVDAHDGDLVAAHLLETELRRAAWRSGRIEQADVATFLSASVTMYELSPSTFTEAGLITGVHLRSLDALHIAAAVRLGCTAIVTYDHRTRAAAAALGLPVLSPS